MTELFVDLDRSSPVPLYFQVAQQIERAITEGDLAPGDRLDNEISLAEQFGLSRPTMRRAIQELVDKGLLVRKRGVGTQVVHGQVTRPVELTSLFDDLTHHHQTPTTKVLINEIIEAPDEVGARLSIAHGSPVLHLRRLRFAHGEALAIMENYLPEPFADLTPEALQEFGLYQLLRSRGITFRVAQQRIGARSATAEEARLLEISRHDAVLTMDRVAYDSAGAAVEFGHHAYRPDRYSFEVTLVDR